MVKNLIQKVNDEVLVVASMAKERNTKKEIKDAAQNLSSYMSRLMTKEVQEWLAKSDDGRNADKEAWKEDTQRRLEEEVVKLKSQVKRLKEENKKIQERLRGNTQTKERGLEVNVTEEQIAGAKTFNDVAKLMDLKWPKTIFKAAHLAKGALLNISKDQADLALLTESGQEGIPSFENKRELLGRFPELSTMEGKLAAMAVTTKIEDINGQREIRERTIFKAELDEDQEDWFDVLTKIKDKMTPKNRTKLVLQPLVKEDKNGLTIRKIAECVFRQTTIKCIIVSPEGDKRERTKGGKINHGNTEAAVITQEGKSYSELLKIVKERVKPGTEAANAIKVVRKSRDGNLLIIMDKDNKEAIKELKTDLVGEEGSMGFRIPHRNGVILIKDIDGLTTKREVEEAIERETEISRELFEVGALRPYFGGTQAVTVKIPKSKMPLMLEKGKIRIGLNYCNMVERVNVNQCYRCWGFGHRRDECTREDRGSACRRCGGRNHLAKDCRDRMYCLNCKEEGHSAGSGACPEFRKAVSRARRLHKVKKSY